MLSMIKSFNLWAWSSTEGSERLHSSVWSDGTLSITYTFMEESTHKHSSISWRNFNLGSLFTRFAAQELWNRWNCLWEVEDGEWICEWSGHKGYRLKLYAVFPIYFSSSPLTSFERLKVAYTVISYSLGRYFNHAVRLFTWGKWRESSLLYEL